MTAALAPTDQKPFRQLGFEELERLHLLKRNVEPMAARTGARTRRARRRDRSGVLKVDHAAFAPFWRLDQPGLDAALDATSWARLRVADDDGVVGYALCGRSATQGYVQRLAVHPTHQGHGLGTALLVDGLRWLARWGAREAVVNTQHGNERSLALYTRLGFVLQPGDLAVLRLDFR